MNSPQEIAEKIKELAKSKNIPIGVMLDELEMSKNTLSSMCSGGRYPFADKLAKIADYLDCSVDYLIGRTESKRVLKLPDDLAEEIENLQRERLNMDIKKCDFCQKPYDWYDGVYENHKMDNLKFGELNSVPREERGRYYNANSIRFCHLQPVDNRLNGAEPLEEEKINDELNMYIDVCPECMWKILKNLYIDGHKAFPNE